MNNRKRLKKLILANKETRWLYRMMQFLALFMVVSCLVVITIAKWIEYDQNKKQEELFGSWDEVFLNVDQDDLNYFRKNAFLEEISIQSIQEKVFLEGDQRVVIGSCDGNFLEMGNIELLEGRMPKHEKEVAVEEEYLEVLGVSGVGDIVPNDSKVIDLRDYKISGVISNYTKRWKLIDERVNYINCFIKTVAGLKYNIYVKYSVWSERDPVINMIDYVQNIQPYNIEESSYFRLMCTIVLIEFIIALLIKSKINRKKIHGDKRKYNFKITNNRFIYGILLMLVTFLVFVTVSNLIKRIYIEGSLADIVKKEIINIFYETDRILFAEDSTIFYWINNHRNLYQIKYLLNFPFDEVIEVVTNILQLMLYGCLMVLIITNKKYNFMQRNRVQIYMVDYFYKDYKIKLWKELVWISSLFLFFMVLEMLHLYIRIDFFNLSNKVYIVCLYLFGFSLFVIILMIVSRRMLNKVYERSIYKSNSFR